MRRAALALVVAAATAALAQPQLLVNGVSVPGATTALVAGVAYAPAADFAHALGGEAVVDVGGGRVTLTLGAAIVQLAMVRDVAQATTPVPALVRDGRPRDGPAAVWTGSEAFVPVKATGEALGGRVAFLLESGSVAVVLPRPRLTWRVEGAVWDERLVFVLDAPTRVVTYHRSDTGVVELRFERTDVTATAAVEGRGFVRASVETIRGTAEARIQLAPAVEPRVWMVPDGAGMQVVVALSSPGPAQAADPPTVRASRWVLDAGHVAGEGAGALPNDVEGELTRTFVDRLAVEVARSAVQPERTRAGPAPVTLEDRSVMAVGADAFVSVHLGDLPRRQLRLYVLDDAGSLEALDRAIRWNAESATASAATDAVRRQVLLRYVPDLAFGRAWASEVARRLAADGWNVAPPVGAPLAVLAGAAGRGMLLELSADDLRDPTAAAQVAAALVAAWSAIGGR